MSEILHFQLSVFFFRSFLQLQKFFSLSFQIYIFGMRVAEYDL